MHFLQAKETYWKFIHSSFIRLIRYLYKYNNLIINEFDLFMYAKELRENTEKSLKLTLASLQLLFVLAVVVAVVK